jgi:ectoine hydroxylase-related dioxygenase (phytanoyl-CoA dioxygenase family)
MQTMMESRIPSATDASLRRPMPTYRPDQIGTEAAAFYRDQGFLVVTDALAPSEVDEMRRETVRICRGELGEVEGLPPVADGMSDDEALAQVLCVHMAHKISPVILRSLAHPAIVKTLTCVISPNVKCMQSMLFIKASGKPGQAWHQDELYIPTRDRTLCGGWMALDDATVDNGCLWVIPGSHRTGVLWPQFPHDDKRFDCAWMSYNFPYTAADAVPVEVPAGAIVFFNGYLLHMSLPNTRAAGYRRALVNHYMSAESLLPWFANPNVGGAQNDMRDIVMIAGEDPYAYKGIVDVLKPGVRPSGEGGCGDGRMPLENYLRSGGPK